MPPSRITRGQVMGVIAALVVAFAVAPAPKAINFSVLLVVACGIAAFSRVSWPRAAGWAFTCDPSLPLATLYATWGDAWYTLGRPPRPSLDDPKFIGPLVAAPHLATWVLLFGFLSALAINVALAAIEFIRTLHDGPDDLKRFTARVVLPTLSWPLADLWITADPGGVFDWLLD
jgi:hypothetical protein